MYLEEWNWLTFLQVSLMSGLMEDYSLFVSASAFSLLPTVLYLVSAQGLYICFSFCHHTLLLVL